MAVIRKGETYLTTEEAAVHLIISTSRLDQIRKSGRLKRYRMGDTAYYKLPDLNLLTFNDLMGPFDPDGDEGILFEFEW